jgi:hypothetical protein
MANILQRCNNNTVTLIKRCILNKAEPDELSQTAEIGAEKRT